MNDYDITAAFRRIEDVLIASMMRNMKRHRAEELDEGFAWSMWQAEQLQALEQYRQANQRKYKKEFGELNKQMEALIRRAYETGGMEQEVEILRAIKNGFKPGRWASSAPLQGQFFKLNERKLEALIQATRRDMQKAEMAILRQADDQYRKAIYNAQVYANTGAGTYEQAVDMATKDMLSAGLKCVRYKNGARHALASYAEMALRTASKRAYLQGEGGKRQEWGISTVVVNKRGAPCPLCLPFVGKVLIDDVWSGGSAEGSKYPLMSYAISQGLYHPNCQDVHSTYFPGISSADDTWTKEELAAIESKNKKASREYYIASQIRKYERLAKNSLDADAQRKYRAKVREWKTKYEELEVSQ